MGSRKVKVGAREVTIKTSKIPKGAPRSKRPGANNTPARQRYWQSRRLEERKIRHLMLHNGLSRAEAYNLWHTVRKGRKKF